MRKGILDIYFENERYYLGNEHNSISLHILPNISWPKYKIHYKPN